MHFYVIARVLNMFYSYFLSHVFSGKSAESSMGFIAFITSARTSNAITLISELSFVYLHDVKSKLPSTPFSVVIVCILKFSRI